MKLILCFAAAAIAICLMTPAAYAQRHDLDLRFHAPFPFSVGNNTFAAGDYEITRQGKWTLVFWDGGNRVAKLVNVRPASLSKDANGHARIVFHRYANQYFLTSVSEGSWDSTFGVYTSKEETQLANAKPQNPVIVSIVPCFGALQAAGRI